MLRNAARTLCCVMILGLAPVAQAQDIAQVVPTNQPVRIGGGPGVTDTPYYDNTTGDLYRLPLDAEAPATEFADDIPFASPDDVPHVNSFTFGYVTNVAGDHEIVVNFYNSLADDDGPGDPSLAISFDLTGLPGSDDGAYHAFAITVDLAGQGLDFDWAANTTSFGYNTNWLGFVLPATVSPLICDGGTSMDVFWSSNDLNAPYDPGSFFWFFGGPPAPLANFYITVNTP